MVKKTKKTNTLRKKLLIVIKFLIIFNLLAIPLYVAMNFNFSYIPLQKFLTSASIYFIEMFGYHATLIDDSFCNVPSISINKNTEPICISWDCTGWKSMYVLTALAIATPLIGWKSKLKFLGIGIPIIFVINYLRITTTMLIALKFGWQYLDVVHNFLWREGLILAVVLIWYIWLRKEKYNIW
jgi:exosortase/archaeosortase family protein